MTRLLLEGILLIASFGAGWFWGWKQGKRGLPMVSDKPRF
jgi:hypothetical protein